MPPYSRWVHQSFKAILHKYCDEFLASSDRGPEKTRSKLITQVSQEISDVAQRQVDASLPDDLEKVNVPLSTRGQVINRSVQCVRTWFYNYAGGNATQERPGKSKAETRGHPISSRTWTAKSVCSHLHAERISHEQKSLSDNGEKNIGKYRAALVKVFDALSDAEKKECEKTAAEWNTTDLPDDVQQK